MIRRIWSDNVVFRFALVLVLVLTTTGAGVMWATGAQHRDHLIHIAEQRSAHLAETSVLLFDVTGVPERMDDPAVRALLRLLDRSLAEMAPAGYAVYDRDGTMFFDLDLSRVGTRAEIDTARFDAVVAAGGPVSRMVPSQATAPAQAPGDTWLQTLMPLSFEGYPQFVVHINQDAEPVLAQVWSAQRQLLGIVGLGGLAIVVLLLPALVRLRRRLHHQSDRLQDLLADEQDMTRTLRRVAEMKDIFLSAVSHDLRTPLTVVRGLAGTLRAHDRVLTPERREFLLTRLEANAERLQRLLMDLLDVDRLTRDVLEPTRRWVDLSSLARTVLDHVAAPEHHITVVGDGTVSHVDPAWTERILENLVRNAIKHTPAGTVVVVHLAADEERTTIVVEDSGDGIPAEERTSILEPFHRLDATAPSPGSGIGLTLVAGFARAHGGEVTVGTAPLGGAAFTVQLRHAPEEEPRPASLRPRVGAPGSLRPSAASGTGGWRDQPVKTASA